MKRPSGMTGFTIIAIGQFLSLVGTAMTGFAIPIWVFQQTGRATDLSLLGFAFVVPMLVVSPLAGAIVDRSNRKLMMMLSDLAAGVVTIVGFVLVSFDALQVWQLFIANIIIGSFQSFQWPAYSAAISTMVAKENYGRANGLMSLSEAGSGILAPVFAAALLAAVGLRGVLLVDMVTFVFAIGTLLLVHIPDPERKAEHATGQSNLLNESMFGFRYILERPSLLGLQGVFMVGNFFASIAFSVITAYVLLRTANSEAAVATVQSAAALGGVIGGVLMSTWGGFKRQIHGVLLGWIITFLALMLYGIGGGVVVWAIAGVIEGGLGAIINGSNQAIWQAKVPPDLQGRVFTIRRLVAWGIMPIATLMAGPLVDYVFEPAMAEGGLLRPLGWLVGGTGPGTGVALMYILISMLGLVAGTAGYALPFIRNVETLLPDHDQVAGPTGTPVEEPAAAA